MNKFLIIYLIGVGVDIVSMFFLEWLYFYAGHLRYITFREILEDLGLAVLSWLTTLALIGIMVLEASCGFISKGQPLIVRGIVDDEDPLAKRVKKLGERNKVRLKAIKGGKYLESHE